MYLIQNELFRLFIFCNIFICSAHIIFDKDGEEHEDGYYLDFDFLRIKESVEDPKAFTASDFGDGKCIDALWCNIPMPSTSFFKFRPPSDPIKWRGKFPTLNMG